MAKLIVILPDGTKKETEIHNNMPAEDMYEIIKNTLKSSFNIKRSAFYTGIPRKFKDIQNGGVVFIKPEKEAIVCEKSDSGYLFVTKDGVCVVKPDDIEFRYTLDLRPEFPDQSKINEQAAYYAVNTDHSRKIVDVAEKSFLDGVEYIKYKLFN